MNKRDFNLNSKPENEEELKKAILNEFKEERIYLNVVEEAVKNLNEKHKGKLSLLIECIKNIINPVFEKENGKIKAVNFKYKITDEEIENYLMLIATEMYTLNEYMDSKYLDMELSNYLKEVSIAEELSKITSGSEKERIKMAEFNSMESTLTNIIKTRVLYNIKNNLDAANRVLEVLKKVLSSRMEEKKVFGKSNR